MQADAFALIESELVASGLFKSESVPAMMAAIRANSPPFTPVNANLILGKKARPDSERARISLGDCLASDRPRGHDPATFLQDTCTRCSNIARNQQSLIDMRDLGIKSVRVTFVKNTGSCAKVKKLTGSYPIDEVPLLPLSDCNAKRCFCGYKSVIPGLED
ncbi:hypothetical protein ABZO35_04595 [Burkholderia pseudomallei]|uniref:hypothetical protein n=1 Tax=Burkholderia pseudomallei TaxID=28450 RepID=UPI00344C6D5A